MKVVALSVLVLVGSIVCPRASLAQIAFSAFKNGHWRIFIQNKLGAKPTEVVTYFNRDLSSPALSADGKQIVFEVQDKGIARCKLASSTNCSLLTGTDGNSVRPSFDPAGQSIFYAQFEKTAEGEDSTIVQIDLEHFAPSVVLSQSGIQEHPRISPGGRGILLYVSSQIVANHTGVTKILQTIWKNKLSDGTSTQLYLFKNSDINPAWSPSGEMIAYSSNVNSQEQFEIYTAEASGENRRQLTSGNGSKTWPAWSPDAKQILYSNVVEGVQQLWISSFDGTKQAQYFPFGTADKTEVRDPDWR